MMHAPTTRAVAVSLALAALIAAGMGYDGETILGGLWATGLFVGLLRMEAR